MSADPVDRVILVGFMCSGKSTVGPLLARRLGWEFVDFDERIEREQGRSIARIFREEGEPYFRSLEAEMAGRMADRDRLVMAPGGGWITQPDLVARLRPRACLVWLRAAPETIYERFRRQALPARPLLDGPDPLARIRSLLAERTPLYATAELAVETDGRTPEEVAAEIERELRAAART